MNDQALDLYMRIADETELLLRKQLEFLGVDVSDLEGMATSLTKKVYFPDDDSRLATYLYNDTPILTVRMSENGLAIEFEIPNIKKETQDAL